MIMKNFEIKAPDNSIKEDIIKKEKKKKNRQSEQAQGLAWKTRKSGGSDLPYTADIVAKAHGPVPYSFWQ